MASSGALRWSTADALDALLLWVELHDVHAEERIVSLVERGTALSPNQLARCLEHLADEGDAEAAFQLALFNIYVTPRNPLNVDRLLRQLHTDGHPKAALQLGLLIHTLQDGPDGDHTTLEFFPGAAAWGRGAQTR